MDNWKACVVDLPNPYGPFEQEAMSLVHQLSGRKPKIKGRDGRQYFVAPDRELAAIARQCVRLSN